MFTYEHVFDIMGLYTGGDSETWVLIQLDSLETGMKDMP